MWYNLTGRRRDKSPGYRRDEEDWVADTRPVAKAVQQQKVQEELVGEGTVRSY